MKLAQERVERVKLAQERVERVKLAQERVERMRLVMQVAASIAVIALAGCASLQPQAPTLVSAAQSGGTVHLHKGDTLVVALDSASPAPPSASGYRWQAQPLQGAVLRQIGMSDLLPQKLAWGAVGAPNDTVYRFHANEVGTTTLELALRPADGGPAAAPQRTVRYDVSVEARPGEYAQAWAKTR